MYVYEIIPENITLITKSVPLFPNKQTAKQLRCQETTEET